MGLPGSRNHVPGRHPRPAGPQLQPAGAGGSGEPHAYHRDQHGSASIKNVLPALTGTGYSHLAIQDGNAAARAFAAAEFGDLTPDAREQVRRDLLAYCRLDTQAMVDLLDALRIGMVAALGVSRPVCRGIRKSLGRGKSMLRRGRDFVSPIIRNHKLR